MKKTILCIGFVLFFQIVNSIPINNAYQVNNLNSRVVTLSIDSLKKLVKEMQALKILFKLNPLKKMIKTQNVYLILNLLGFNQLVIQ